VLLACTAFTGTARADGTPAWLDAPLARGPVAGTLAVDDRRVWWGIDGTLPLGFGAPALRAPLDRAHMLGLGLSIAGDTRADTRDLRYTAWLDRRSPRAGEWLGLSTGRGGAGTRLDFGSGVWRSLAHVQIETGVVTSLVPLHEQVPGAFGFYRTTHDTLYWVDSTSFQRVDRTHVSTMTQGSLRWQFGRVEASAAAGVVLFGVRAPRRWAQATAEVHATQHLLVMAAFGQRPAASQAFDPSVGPRTMLGVRFAPWAARSALAAGGPRLRAWSVHGVTAGRSTVRVRCDHASSVDITGDFTDWAPVALASEGGGWWQCALPIAPGLHQVQVRIDGGAWQPPPGLPTTQGDFAGTAGVLVVE